MQRQKNLEIMGDLSKKILLIIILTLNEIIIQILKFNYVKNFIF